MTSTIKISTKIMYKFNENLSWYTSSGWFIHYQQLEFIIVVFEVIDTENLILFKTMSNLNDIFSYEFLNCRSRSTTILQRIVKEPKIWNSSWIHPFYWAIWKLDPHMFSTTTGPIFYPKNCRRRVKVRISWPFKILGFVVKLLSVVVIHRDKIVRTRD